MNDSSKFPRMRKMDLNDEVTIKLPVHVWLGFNSAYNTTEWASPDATAIMREVQETVYDPLWLKEAQAEQQRNHDRNHQIFSGITGFPGPEIPPDAGGLSDGN